MYHPISSPSGAHRTDDYLLCLIFHHLFHPPLGLESPPIVRFLLYDLCNCAHLDWFDYSDP